MKKQDLKNIIKECLRELIQEEKIVQVVLSSNNLSIPSSKTPTFSSTISPTKKENSIEENNKNIKSFETQGVNPLLLEKVEQLSKTIGNGKQSELMKGIFFDTAMTTLQEQLVPGDSNGMYDPTELIVSNASAASLSEQKNPQQNDSVLKELSVDGDISRWAKVAFAKK